MSDTGNNNPPPGPVPPDPAAVERLYAAHRQSLATYNADDPASPVYRRPDLAAEYRGRLERDFADILTRHGISPPQPETPEQVRECNFEEHWAAPISDTLVADMDRELEREEALSDGQRTEHIAELKREFGEDGYAAMVEQARAAFNPGEVLPDAAKANRFVLMNLAARGRYNQAYGRARKAAEFRS